MSCTVCYNDLHNLYWSLLHALTLEGLSQLQQTTFKNIFHCFSEKIRLDVSSESSARQRIHMNIKPYFLRKIKVKKIKCCLLQFLFGTLRANNLWIPEGSKMQAVKTLLKLHN